MAEDEEGGRGRSSGSSSAETERAAEERGSEDRELDELRRRITVGDEERSRLLQELNDDKGKRAREQQKEEERTAGLMEKTLNVAGRAKDTAHNIGVIGSWILYFIILCAIIALIGILAWQFIVPMVQGSYEKAYEDYGWQGVWDITWDYIVEILKKITFWDYWERQREITYRMARGDFYTSTVDENAKEKLGVFIETVEAAESEFREDEPITLWAILQAKTLDKPIGINISCEGDGLPYDILKPRTTFTVDTEEEQDLDCTFYKNKFKAGSVKVVFSAVFDFETMSYIKTYFMDRETLRTMRKENIDVYERFEIERNPIAIHTSGPIAIGMNLPETPIGIDTKAAGYSEIQFGVSIQNLWEGKVMDINKFVIMLPKGFELANDEDNGETYCGGYSFLTCDEFKEKENTGIDVEEECLSAEAGSNVYIIDSGINKSKLIYTPEDLIGDYKNIRCRLKVDESNYDAILGNTPISTQYFKTTIGYKYKISEQKIVIVKKAQTVSKTLQKTKCDAKVYKKDAQRLSDDWFIREKMQRYIKYQEDVKRYASREKPNEVQLVEMEALMAAVMDIASNIADVENEKTMYDSDKDQLPDYIMQCWGYKDAPGIYMDNTDSDLSCSAKELKNALILYDNDKGKAMTDYFEKRRDLLKDKGINVPAQKEELEKYYNGWLNELCSEESTVAAGSEANLLNKNGSMYPPKISVEPKAMEISYETTAETKDIVHYKEKGSSGIKDAAESTSNANKIRVTGLKEETVYEYYLELYSGSKVERYPAEKDKFEPFTTLKAGEQATTAGGSTTGTTGGTSAGTTEGTVTVSTVEMNNPDIVPKDKSIMFNFGSPQTFDRVRLKKKTDTNFLFYLEREASDTYVTAENLEPNTEYDYFLESLQEVAPFTVLKRYPLQGSNTIRTASKPDTEFSPFTSGGII